MKTLATVTKDYLRNLPNEVLLNFLSEEQKEHIFRTVWRAYIEEDIVYRLEEKGMIADTEISKKAAILFVDFGDYDCELDYWSNIDNLITKAQETKN